MSNIRLPRRAVLGMLPALGFLPRAARAAGQSPLSFVGWSQAEPGSAPVLAKIFEGFRTANPDINLKLIGFPWGQTEQNLILRLRSHQPTGVAQVQERWLFALQAMGGLADMDSVFGRAYLEARMDPALLKIGEVDGKLWGIPWTAAAIALNENRQLLRETGQNFAPPTMDAFRATLQAIKKARPDSIPFGLSTKTATYIQSESQIIFWQFGARFFNAAGDVVIDQPEARDALSFLVGLMKDGLITKAIDRLDARKLFAQGRVGFYFDPPVARAFAKAYTPKGSDFYKDVWPTPTPIAKPGIPPRSIQWAHLLCMFATPGADLSKTGPAAKLISYLALNPASQLTYFKESGLFPTCNAALSQLRDDAYVSTWVSIAKTALPDEPARFTDSSTLGQIIGQEVEAALLGDKTSAAALKSMAERLNRAQQANR
ncbi:MAG: extracellular solute-binding protein [Rhodospirillales bacterium]|nr:extracellular solute-binding protein [Rhodospirillales bacterium]